MILHFPYGHSDQPSPALEQALRERVRETLGPALSGLLGEDPFVRKW